MSDDRTEGIESIIGKAAFDDAFAEALKEDPEAALRGIGIEPTDEMLEALGEIDPESLEKLAKAFEPQPGIG